ncbi:hypothetical protein MRB53_040761 [Persea americana]|nr:hypothetical protein MRB53_040761 [Persea americana]
MDTIRAIILDTTAPNLSILRQSHGLNMVASHVNVTAKPTTSGWTSRRLSESYVARRRRRESEKRELKAGAAKAEEEDFALRFERLLANHAPCVRTTIPGSHCSRLITARRLIDRAPCTPPETYVVNENGKEKICGVANIDHARLELKCNFCRSKRGACFQCSSKKCTRAFHATCAIAAGVLIDAGPVPTFGADGTEYFEEGFDFRCRYHRPKMPKHPNIDAMESSKRVKQLCQTTSAQ